MSRKYPEGFYVYLHRRKSDGLVFYVGKGIKYRAWSFARRHEKNPYWENTLKKHGVIVEILASSKNESCMLTLEKITITKYKNLGHPLTNLTDGGEGASGFRMGKEERILRSRSYGCNGVYCSNGMFFETYGDAERWLSAEIGERASAAAISRCARGVRYSYKGYCWSIDEAPDHPEIHGVEYRSAAVSGKISKPVYSSLGEVFQSVVSAGRAMDSIGYSSSKSNISSCARGVVSSACGRAWSYNGVPEHPKMNKTSKVRR